MKLIIAEHNGKSLSTATLSLVNAARQSSIDGEITLLILGHGVTEIAHEAARYADRVLVADHPEFTYDPAVWSTAAAQIARQLTQEGQPALVLISGGRQGREYAPRIAALLDAPYLEDIIALTYKKGWEAQRFVYLGRVLHTLQTDAPLVITSIKSGAFSAAEPLKNIGGIRPAGLEPIHRRVRMSDVQSEQRGKVALSDAKIVVTGGRGLGSADKFEHLVAGLANVLGAGIGATRGAVHAGWRPYAEQIGQTGKTVEPAVYIALGASGAVQHMSGANKSDCIIAINKDPHAPIFELADYSVVGDVTEVVPALIEVLKEKEG